MLFIIFYNIYNKMDSLTDNLFSNDEILLMVYDILRTLTMQIIVQSLVVANNEGIPFLSTNFIQVTLFLILGIMVFWMIVYKYLAKNNTLKNYLTERKLLR